MADHIFCNRMNDVRGCKKLLEEDYYSYVKPGLSDGMFQRDENARARLRARWQADDVPVIMTAAMMRHGVKAKGLEWVINSCAELLSRGRKFHLAVAGDGPRRAEMEARAVEMLGDRVTFFGMVDRADLGDVFSGGDLFVFPGLEESVGMVYLEAQQCGLPVVATDDEGAPYVVEHGTSGLVTSVSQSEFTEAIDRLLTDAELRTKMGRQAIEYATTNHSANTNYREMARIMERIVLRRKGI